MTIHLTSSAFAHGETIPEEYTCLGRNSSPPLSWRDVPPHTQSLALTFDDPDAPSGIWVHWVLYNLPAGTSSLPFDVPATDTLPDGACQGVNDFGNIGYGGPCPPAGKPHRYIFTIYALDTTLDLDPQANRRRLIEEMDGHIIDEGQLMGLFSRA